MYFFTGEFQRNIYLHTRMIPVYLMTYFFCITVQLQNLTFLLLPLEGGFGTAGTLTKVILDVFIFIS